MKSLMFYHVCVFDITSLKLKGRKIYAVIFFFMSYIEGEFLFYSDHVFHSLYIHSFNHIRFSLTFLRVYWLTGLNVVVNS
jgi:hypothetical protein